MKIIRRLFTKNLFLVLLSPILLLLIYFLFNQNKVETWGVNKTVGWAWDITDFIFIYFPLYLLFLISYGILSAFKIKTHLTISIIHILLIMTPILTFNNYNYNYIHVTFYSIVLSVVFFITNIIISLKNRKYDFGTRNNQFH